MSRSWYEIASRNLFELSQEKEDFKKAMLEWKWTGEPPTDLKEETEENGDLDYEEPQYYISCQLCEKPYLRYVFTIKNETTGARMLVGSECIKKFTRHQYKGKEQKIRIKEIEKADRTRKESSRKKYVISCLHSLVPTLPREMVDKFIDHYKKNESFRPEELVYIFRALRIDKREYNPKNFKIRMKSLKEKRELTQVGKNAIKDLLWDSMSANQRKWCESHRLL